jgi:UDP-N-acetylglucosamine:LPS N-acetylglucosamine transferase
MGEGHNATGRALQAAAGRIWPECSVTWVDTLDVMGRGVGPLFRRIYTSNVERTPWLYEFFYRSVWRYRWFANSSKRFVGEWSGRRLAEHIDRGQPDLIISTYPLGSAGLAWLRRHRGLDIPVGAWVSDFAPHPFWVYRDLDLHLVMHDVAVPVAGESEPGAAVAVSAPTVTDAFQPGDQLAARRRLDLPEEAFTALVSCGSLGFGRSEVAVRELLDGDPDACVVVVCGRNDRLRARIEAAFPGDSRVRVLGWVDDMAGLMVAADVVVTNAGGATSLEALACGRPLLMHQPIAGHGKANAELMARAGLAEVCPADGDLARAVTRLRREPDRLAAMRRAATEHCAAHDLVDGLRSLAAVRRGAPSRPVRAEDALFVHVDTAQVPQQVGAVIVFEPGPDGQLPTFADATAMVGAVPGIRGRLDRGSPLRRPRWREDNPVDLADLVDRYDLARDDPGRRLDEIVDAYYSRGFDGRRSAGDALYVTGLPDGRAALLVKLHHALGDGITVLRALLSATDSGGRSWASPPAPPVGRRLPRGLGLRRTVRGLWTLAGAGRAPGSPVNGHLATPARHHAFTRLPGRPLRTAARKLGVTANDLLVAVFAEALHRTLNTEAARTTEVLRVMLPWSLRSTETLRSTGNQTGAVAVDLPVGPMPLGRRLELVRDAVRARVDAGVPEAAHLVVRAIGLLPPPLHAGLARWMYRSTWFNAIASVLPGPRWEVRFAGARVCEALPVLPLAPGVGLSWGAMIWGDRVIVGFTGGPWLGGRVDRLATETEAALRDYVDLAEAS